MKKSSLQKAYGEVPQSFHNTLLKTLNGLEEIQTDLSRPKRNRVFKTAVACALVLAIGAVGVVSAKAIYPMVIGTEGNYGLNIELEPMSGDSDTSLTNAMNLSLSDASKDAPEYVKMTIGYLPDGVIENQGKYSLNGECEEKCFTFVPDRVVEKQTFTEGNIKDYQELKIRGNNAILANVADIPFQKNPFSKRFYIYFEKEAFFLTAYVTDDVSDEEIKKVMENITVEECAEEEATGCSLTQAKEDLQEEKYSKMLEKIAGAFDLEEVCEYSEVEMGQEISLGEGASEYGLKFSFDKIEVLDNISDLNYNSFDQYDSENLLPIYTDENGNFVPRERENYIFGDGISSPNVQVVSTDTITTKMVYITLKVSNPTNGEKTFALQSFGIDNLVNELAVQNGEKSNEDFENTEQNNVTHDTRWTEACYIDNNNVEQSGYAAGFNFLSVPANSTETVHIGFFVDEDDLDGAYVFCDMSWCQAVFDSKKSEFIGSDKENYNNMACIKVK